MIADMGFSNAFAQAGLWNDGKESDDDSSNSMITAMTSVSGGAWFAAQFFYSEQFYNATTKSIPAELSQFVLDWMDSYRAYTATFPQGPLEDQAECNLLEVLNTALDMRIVRMLVDNCALFVDLNGNWANFVEGMLATTAAGYGDVDFVSRPMTSENRIAPLRSTNVGIQMALVANSRLRKTTIDQDHDQIIDLGQMQGDDSFMMHSLPIGLQWFVSDHRASYISNIQQQHGASFPSGLATYQRDSSNEFAFSEFQDHFLFPAENAASLVNVQLLENGTVKNINDSNHTISSFREPFGGVPPSVAQATAASSAALGFLSALAPSTFAQVLSLSGY
jgi:hypothetical protein